VTYNAPATAPVSDLTVTVTATSAADTTKSGFREHRRAGDCGIGFAWSRADPIERDASVQTDTSRTIHEQRCELEPCPKRDELRGHVRHAFACEHGQRCGDDVHSACEHASGFERDVGGGVGNRQYEVERRVHRTDERKREAGAEHPGVRDGEGQRQQVSSGGVTNTGAATLNMTGLTFTGANAERLYADQRLWEQRCRGGDVHHYRDVQTDCGTVL
jgi:hypothetical protein